MPFKEHYSFNCTASSDNSRAWSALSDEGIRATKASNVSESDNPLEDQHFITV